MQALGDDFFFLLFMNLVLLNWVLKTKVCLIRACEVFGIENV